MPQANKGIWIASVLWCTIGTYKTSQTSFNCRIAPTPGYSLTSTVSKMLSFFDILLWAVVFLIVASIYWYLSIPKNLPPGPIGLPFVGSAIEYLDGRKQHLLLQENVKKYGPIFKLYIGNQLVIVLGNYEAIQEAIVKQGDVFSGRPQFYTGMPEKLRGYGK